MFDELLVPGLLAFGASGERDLMVALRSHMIECQKACEEAGRLRSELSGLSEKLQMEMFSMQQLSKEQDELVNEFVAHGLDNGTSLIDEDDTSCRSKRCVQDVCAHALSSEADRIADSNGENYLRDQALQTTDHIREDLAIEPMRSLTQAMPCTSGECAMELSQPIPEIAHPAADAPSVLSAIPVGPALQHALEPHVTTLVVRSIPLKASQDNLIALWPPTWGYNLIHLPYSLKQRRSVGYVFINFNCNEAANFFYNQWEGRALTMNGSTRALSIHAARVQGLLSNLEHLQAHSIGAVLNDKYLPALFAGTDRICFRAVLRELEATQNSPGTGSRSSST